MPRFSRLRLQRYYKKPIPTKYFSNFFSRIFQKNPQNITYQPFTPSKIFMLYNIFSSIVTRSPLCRAKIFHKRIIFAQITTCLKEHFNKSKTFCRTVRLKLTFPKFGIFQMLTNDIHAFKKKRRKSAIGTSAFIYDVQS